MTYPFPSLKRGAVVAVTKWIPSFPHSKLVESLAYITSSNKYMNTYCNIYVNWSNKYIT